jgi:hypothetical protein
MSESHSPLLPFASLWSFALLLFDFLESYRTSGSIEVADIYEITRVGLLPFQDVCLSTG